jgi:alpha-glucoside transport system permease protein
MEQLLSGLLAIVVGVIAVAVYFYGANFVIDRVFADHPPIFSAADFIAVLSGFVILFAFLWMPWISQPQVMTQGDAVDEVVTTYTGRELLSTPFADNDQSAASTAKVTIILIPLASALAIGFGVWGVFSPMGRGASAVGTTFGGILGLVYFLLTFALEKGATPGISDAAAPGFWIVMIASLVLVLQVVISRPIYTPPTSEMVVKVHTDTRNRIRPWIFVGPALLAITFYLLYPAADTFRRSFFDNRSREFVGLDNYEWLFTDPAVQTAFRNNILWLLVVPLLSVVFGLIVAVLADQVRWESIAKSLVFVPMAISFVGASVVWRFVYHFNPPSRPQIGLLNAIVVELGGMPQGWFIQRPMNNFFLMFILIWVQTGLAMILISAALKSVPEETIEAARIDGANEVQLFFRVTLPQIFGTVLVVYTTIVIVVLKVFDIVYAMTGGQFGTEVLANQMFIQMFRFGNFGRGSAIAIILMLAVAPVMIINVRRFRSEETYR